MSSRHGATRQASRCTLARKTRGQLRREEIQRALLERAPAESHDVAEVAGKQNHNVPQILFQHCRELERSLGTPEDQFAAGPRHDNRTRDEVPKAWP